MGYKRTSIMCLTSKLKFTILYLTGYMSSILFVYSSENVSFLTEETSTIFNILYNQIYIYIYIYK